MEEENQPRKKRFRLFDSQREGKGVSKEEANLPPKLKKFFICYKRDFSRLLSVNIFYVLGNFPVLFLIMALSGIFSLDYTRPLAGISAVWDGARTALGAGGASAALDGVYGAFTNASVFRPIAYVFLALGALTLFTWGLVNVGTAYILRNMVKGDPVFIWSDFWYAVKRNFKQAFFFGIFDLLILAIIPVNMMILSQGSGFGNGILFWLNIVIGFAYFTMRFYIYLQMVTFDLKITKILKNSLIFVFLGFKRNIVAVLGIVLWVFIDLLLAYSGVLLALALMIPLLLLFSNGAYMATYAAYYKVKEIMIDPYLEEHPSAPAEDGADASEA